MGILNKIFGNSLPVTEVTAYEIASEINWKNHLGSRLLVRSVTPRNITGILQEVLVHDVTEKGFFRFRQYGNLTIWHSPGEFLIEEVLETKSQRDEKSRKKEQERYDYYTKHSERFSEH